MENLIENVLATTVKRPLNPTGWGREVKMVLPYLVWLLSASVIVGAHGDRKPQPPQTLVTAAKAFEAAPATNRLAEARSVVQELPRCPLKYEKDVGTGIYRAFDFSKPSYNLSTDAVLTLLGSPAATKTNGASVRLLYLARKSHEQASSEDWFLAVETRSGRVVYSHLTTAPALNEPRRFRSHNRAQR
jgi:hypothetical protein